MYDNSVILRSASQGKTITDNWQWASLLSSRVLKTTNIWAMAASPYDEPYVLYEVSSMIRLHN